MTDSRKNYCPRISPRRRTETGKRLSEFTVQIDAKFRSHAEQLSSFKREKEFYENKKLEERLENDGILESLRQEKEHAIEDLHRERMQFTRLKEEWAIEKRKLLGQISEVRFLSPLNDAGA